jgi:hypothetical protein
MLAPDFINSQFQENPVAIKEELQLPDYSNNEN